MFSVHVNFSLNCLCHDVLFSFQLIIVMLKFTAKATFIIFVFPSNIFIWHNGNVVDN